MNCFKPTLVKILILMLLPSFLAVERFNCEEIKEPGPRPMKIGCPIERNWQLYHFNLPHLLFDMAGDRKREEERKGDQWPCMTDDCETSPWKLFDRDQYYQSIIWIFIHYLLISLVFKFSRK